MQSKPLPIGVDNFEKIIGGKYYYADKTWMRNFLFFTGYLRMVSRRMAGHDLMVTMEIPSEEMAYISLIRLLVLGRNQNAGFINDVPGNAEKGCGDVPKRAVGSSSKKYQLYGRSGIVLSRIPFGDAWKYERVYRKIKPGKEKQAAGHCRTSSRCRTGSGNSGIKDFRYVHTQNPPHTDCVFLGKGWGCRIKKFSYRILLLTENENAISCMPFSCCDSPITTLLCKDNIPTHDT